MSDHPAEKIARDFQDRIIAGTFEGVYALEAGARDGVMECQARTCARAFVELYQIPADLDIDGFIEKMKLGGSSRIRVTRDGDEILWEELHEGQCMCPLVTRGVIPLDPALCTCAVHWLRTLVERHVEGPVEVELVSSAATGSANCSFRIRVG